MNTRDAVAALSRIVSDLALHCKRYVDETDYNPVRSAGAFRGCERQAERLLERLAE